MNFLKGKQVQVRITTDFWVAAVIVSVLEFCQKFGGPKYRVQFDSPDGSGRKELDVTGQDLLPYWPRQ
ncbi:hypothetical protein BGW80DRAFT_1312538 [Lactifluus volemus]|nr:hypothetical protein BGW80DRAFT_1312538 [Lactifluus volemus]